MNSTEQRQAEIEVINGALEQTKGNMAEAAALLGKDAKWVRDKVKSNKVLRVKWLKPPGQLRPIITEAEQISRDHPNQGLPATSFPEAKESFILSEDEEKQRIAEALEREDKAFQNGLAKMGVRGESLEYALAFQKFHGRNFASIIDMAGGGMAKVLLDAMSLLNRDMQRLNQIIETGGRDEEKKDDNPGIDPLNEEKMLRQSISAWLDHIGKTYDRLNKAALIKAQVRAKFEKDKSGMKSANKPNFTPLRA